MSAYLLDELPFYINEYYYVIIAYVLILVICKKSDYIDFVVLIVYCHVSDIVPLVGDGQD